MSIQSVMPSSHLILCRSLLLLPPTPPSIRVFSNESTLRMRWPKYWSGLPFPSLFRDRILVSSSAGRFFAVRTNSSVQFSSVTQLCPTPCHPMNRSTPGLPVHHQLPEFIQTHVHQVGDAIQPSHPLSFPSPPAPNPSQHQGLFQ